MWIKVRNFVARKKNMEKVIDDGGLGRFRALIAAAQRIVVCGHVNPDGDAVGSALALQHWLQRQGKECTVVLPNTFPDFLLWMPGAKDVKAYRRHEAEVAPIIEQADLFVIADLNSPSRLMDIETLVMANPAPKVMIDHHMSPADFCDVTISHPEMCATAEVLCHLFWQLGELQQLAEAEAVCLYAGMMCDTGAFTYASTRSVIYECVSHLLARGIDKDRIYRNVYYTASLARLRLQGYMLYVNLRMRKNLHAAVMTLTNAERRRFGVKNGDTEGLVNMPLQISGTRLSIFLTEDTELEGLVKVSLRSVDDFPCNKMAEEFFGGGGHLNASGGKLYCSMDEALKVVDRALQKYAPLLKGQV